MLLSIPLVLLNTVCIRNYVRDMCSTRNTSCRRYTNGRVECISIIRKYSSSG